MRTWQILVCSGLCILSDGVLADRVTPNEHVVHNLPIHEAPSGPSPTIGHLLPGESLPHAGSVPSWHKVTMTNGQIGFVKKAFATLIPDQPVAPTSAGEIRIGSWNVRKLGHGANKNFALVAQVIESNYDIVAIVEVMQKAGGHPGYDELIAQLGPSSFGIVTNEPRPHTSSGSAEFYAILFRPERVHLCDGWAGLRYHTDNTGEAGSTGVDEFSREPAFACFATTLADGSPGFDFVLAAYHAVFAEGDVSDIQNEVEHIPEVFASMAAAQPGERDLIISGDFNLIPSDLQASIPQLVRTVGTGSTLNSSGALTGNLYDHLIVFDLAATSEMIGPEEVLDVRSVAADNKTYFQTVSDHLPIVGRFRVVADDD
jgi:hypothetical protein